MTAPLSLCVYCGSRDGTDPAYAEAAETLGRAIAEHLAGGDVADLPLAPCLPTRQPAAWPMARLYDAAFALNQMWRAL